MAIDAPLSVTDDYLKKSCVLIATLGDYVAETTAVVKMEDLRRDNTLQNVRLEESCYSTIHQIRSNHFTVRKWIMLEEQ